MRASLSIFLGFSWPSRPALLSRRVDAFTRRIAVHHDSYSSDRHSYAINFNVGTTTKSNRFSLKRTGVDITPPLPTLLPCLPIKKTKTKNSRVQTWRFSVLREMPPEATRGTQLVFRNGAFLDKVDEIKRYVQFPPSLSFCPTDFSFGKN